MARYTLNLSEIIETIMNDDLKQITMNPYDYIDDLVENAVPIIFSNRVPIYVINDSPTPEREEMREEDRKELLKKILKHYWDYEVCTATPYDFIFRINKKLSEIMPYFNRLYASAELEFDPFKDVDYQRQIKTDDVRTGHEESESDKLKTGKDTSTATKTGTDNITSERSGEDVVDTDKDGNDTRTIKQTGKDTVTTDGEEKKTGTEQLTLNTTAATTGGGSSNGTTNTGGVKWDFFNDTPQGRVNWGNDQIPDSSPAPNGDGLPDGDHYNMDYLTRYEKHVDAGSHNTNVTTTTNNSTTNNTGTNTTTFNTKVENDVTQETAYGNNTEDKIVYDSGETETTTYGNKTDTDYTWNNEVVDETVYNNNVNTQGEVDTRNVLDGLKTENVKGKMSTQSYSERLLLFRKTIINIDEMIIEALKELFFKIAN